MSDLIPWMAPWSGRVLVAGVFVIGLLIAARGFIRVRCKSPTCPRCGYNRSHSTSPICPECGRESSSPKELLCRPRRWRLVLVGALVAMALPVFVAQRRVRAYGWDYYTYVGPVAWIDPFTTQESISVDGVTFRLERERTPWSTRQRVVIRDADGERVANDDWDHGYWRWVLALGHLSGRMSRETRHVAVQEWSLGGNCCFTYWIYEVRDRRAIHIARLDARSSEVSFNDVDGDGIDEITIRDDTFAFWHVYGDWPLPGVALQRSDDGLALAADLMRVPEIDLATADKLTDQLNRAWREPRRATDNGIPVAVWTIMLDLIYSGRADFAFELIAQTWPAKAPDRKAFEQEFLAKLATSQWAEELAAMNGGSFAERLMPFVRLVQSGSTAPHSDASPRVAEP